MKSNIHPNYAKVSMKCVCGNVVDTYSAAKTASIDVCSVCHPFFGGKQKRVDTAGRIQRFRKRYA